VGTHGRERVKPTGVARYDDTDLGIDDAAMCWHRREQNRCHEAIREVARQRNVRVHVGPYIEGNVACRIDEEGVESRADDHIGTVACDVTKHVVGDIDGDIRGASLCGVEVDGALIACSGNGPDCVGARTDKRARSRSEKLTSGGRMTA
jgi:hypothetical protein